jgi:hypothetical protein
MNEGSYPLEEVEGATCLRGVSRAGAAMVRGLEMHRAAGDGDGAAVAQLGRMVVRRLRQEREWR